MKKLLLQTFLLLAAFSAQAQYAFTNFDIFPGAGDSYPEYFIEHNGKLYFRAINTFGGLEVYSTDGTISGTQMLMDINSGPTGSNPRLFTSYMGRLFFVAEDGVHGNEIWGTNGTTAGTNILKDIWVGRMASSPKEPVVALGSLYFAANDSAHGFELWKSDGTPGGTIMINDNAPGKSLGAQPFFFGYQKKVYYTGSNNGVHSWLWQSDGTAAGTKFVKGLRFCSDFFEYNGKMYFSAFDSGASEKELWVSDGTYAGTQKMLKNKVLRPFTKPIMYNGKFIFSSGSAGGGLFISDGTEAGTQKLSSWGADANGYAIYKGVMYYCATDGIHGKELWRTDGTPAGTFMVKDINEGGKFSSPGLFTVCKGKLFFKAIQYDSLAQQLFVSDGTELGTKMISPVQPPAFAPLSKTSSIIAYNDTLYFQAEYDNNGLELWSVKDTSHYVGVTDIVIGNELEVFPNPSSGYFTVKIKDGDFYTPVVTVYDMTGKEVYHGEFSNATVSLHLQLTGIAKGIYNLRVQDGDKLYRQKVMIE